MEKQTSGSGAEKLVLIADAGATHTRALVANVDGRILGTGRSGAGNAFAIGHTEACRNLRKALGTALQECAHPACSPCVYRDRAAQALPTIAAAHSRSRRRCGDTSKIPQSPSSATDELPWRARWPARREWSRSPAPDPSCWARILRDGCCVIGGWGPLAGDEGSAQWTGRRAIQEAAHASDGIASLLC